MANGLNRVVCLGNLGFDADLKHTSGGNTVLKFKVAASERYKDNSGEWQEKTEWVPCVLWGKRAEGLAPHMKKGKKVYVEGKFTTRSWEADDGSKRHMSEVNVREVLLLSPRGEATAQAGDWDKVAKGDKDWKSRDTGRQPAADDFGDDDIPF